MRRATIILAVLLLAACARADVGRVASADGVEIAYETWGAGDRTVVLVHGWSCDRTYWRDQTAHLAGSWRVVAVDLAGHGESGLGRESYTMQAFGADVAAVLQAEDITGAVLVGHSMGGPVIVEAALQAPDRVRGLVGIDNFQTLADVFTQEQIDGFVGAMAADFPGVADPMVRGMFRPDSDPELVDEIAGDMSSAPPAVAVDALAHTLPWFCGGGVPSLERLAVNLVCVISDLYPAEEDEVRAVVPGFRVWVLEGTGHFLMREKPQEFNALLDEALASFFDQAAPSAPGAVRLE